ncbi:MAG: 2-C-methyl-D-erythritol 2,4-cyclodiphosphate synthase [Candidatus Omnitrophota bacterium]|jgi:2-C-methyl-D-erythritol 2,4-cyclodiphosphate synthase
MNANLRIGLGNDIHRLEAGRELWLGGVLIPYDKGLLGHSDADIVIHAVADAILGALGLGDIGEWFPDNDAKYKNMAGKDLLGHVMTEAKQRSASIINADIIIQAEQPKLKEHKSLMRSILSTLLEIDAANINIKAKTNEGLDAVGRQAAMSCQAIVLIQL